MQVGTLISVVVLILIAPCVLEGGENMGEWATLEAFRLTLFHGGSRCPML